MKNILKLSLPNQKAIVSLIKEFILDEGEFIKFFDCIYSSKICEE